MQPSGFQPTGFQHGKPDTGGAGDVTVGGQTLTVTPSLIDGSVTGTANVTGQTLSVTPTLTSGTVAANADEAGQTLTVTPTLTSGSVTGTANVSGQTLTVTPTLTSGSVSANADVAGQTLTVSPTLLSGTLTVDNPGTAADELLLETGTDFLLQEDGSYIRLDAAAGGDVSVGGRTLTVTPTIIAGSVSAGASVSGQTLTVSPTLTSGSVTANADVAGQTLTVTPVLIDGNVSAGGNVSISGETISVTVLLIDGTVSIVGEDARPPRPPGGDDAPVWSNPVYVKDKKRKRAHEVEEDLEALYDRVMGIKPVTKEAKKAVAAVKRAMAPHREPDQTFDWEAAERDLKVAIALRRAAKAIEDDEEEAVTALLLAG